MMFPLSQSPAKLPAGGLAFASLREATADVEGRKSPDGKEKIKKKSAVRAKSASKDGLCADREIASVYFGCVSLAAQEHQGPVRASHRASQPSPSQLGHCPESSALPSREDAHGPRFGGTSVPPQHHAEPGRMRGQGGMRG